MCRSVVPAIGGLLLGVMGVFALPAAGHAATTSSLFPIADGSLDSAAWTTSAGAPCSGASCFAEVAETGGSECSGSDGDTTYIQSATQNAAQTFGVSLTDIPDSATITDITVTACHVKGQSGQPNKFQTRYCLNGACTDSGNDITPPANYNEASQNFSGLTITKTGTTDLEIGVVITDNANKQTRVSQLSAVLTYTVVGSDASDSPGKSGEPHGKGHNSEAPLVTSSGADEAPIKLDQGQVQEMPNGNIVHMITAAPGQVLKLTARPVDSDRAQAVRLRVAGRIYHFQDNDRNGVYELPLRLAGVAESVPYSLTVDYGITTRTEYGSFVLGARQELMPFIHRLFRAVHDRDPSLQEWEYWAHRVQAGHKRTLPELYGAMQWQEQFGGKPELQRGDRGR